MLSYVRATIILYNIKKKTLSFEQLASVIRCILIFYVKRLKNERKKKKEKQACGLMKQDNLSLGAVVSGTAEVQEILAEFNGATLNKGHLVCPQAGTEPGNEDKRGKGTLTATWT